jgi:hypothetical protein
MPFGAFFQHHEKPKRSSNHNHLRNHSTTPDLYDWVHAGQTLTKFQISNRKGSN